MKLWGSLYAIIWVILIEFLLAMTPADPDSLLRTGLVYAHIGLGVVLLGLAYLNFDGLRKTRVPARVKRISKSTFQLSILMAITGVLLAIRLGESVVIPLVQINIFQIVLLVHVVNAFAIIAQAAAAAIGYDMWEEKEWLQETEAGEVPVKPMPAPRTP